MPWNHALRSGPIAFLLAMVGHLALTGGCSSSTPAASTSDEVDLASCTRACDASTPCGHGLACVPSLKGGSICKPVSCPACAAGKFCLVDSTKCTPIGCTSGTCGFNSVGPCDDCSRASCCDKLSACAADPGCNALVTCESKCSSDAGCQTGCRKAASAAALAMFDAAFGCLQQKCNQECYNGAAPPSGAGGAAGAPTMCGAAESPCLQASECCSGACDTKNSRCRCATAGAKCSGNEDCCSQNCECSGTGQCKCADSNPSCYNGSACSPLCPHGQCPGSKQQCTAYGECCSPDPSIQCGDNGCGQTYFCGQGYVCQGTKCVNPCSVGGPCPDGLVCMGGNCEPCMPSCAGGSTCGTTCSGQSCGTCPANEKCIPMLGGAYCTGMCTPSCAGRNCGSDGCLGSCGTCAPDQICSSAGVCTDVSGAGGGSGSGGGGQGAGGSSSGSCTDESGCVQVYAGSGVCKGYTGLNNTCGAQVSCHYQLSNGQQGCSLPQPGSNDCAIFSEGAAISIVCVSGDVACVNKIGCSL